jgi:hypothetical protein
MNRGALQVRAWYTQRRKETGGEYRLLDLASEVEAHPTQLSKWLSGEVKPLVETRAKFMSVCGTPLLDWDVPVHGRTEWRTESGELVLEILEPSSGAA